MQRKKLYLVIVAIVILAIAAVGGGWVWLKSEMGRAINHTAAQKTITIESGTSTSTIVARLHTEGILPDTFPVKLWLRLFERGVNLKSGDYRFKSPISPLQVLNQLIKGEIAMRQVTIPEGFNQYDIARVLSGLQGLKQSAMSQESILELLKDVALISDLDPDATTLEGYLFPDTYEYSASTTREQLVEAMVKRFRRVYTPEMQQRAAELGMTTRQVVAMASLIEKEAKVDSEREMISSVFHRRWKTGVPLACDPTVIYAALVEGKYRGKIYQSDLDRDSAYNTYKHAGLPPGPIASPGQRSLQAALNPAQTDYLFFVVDAIKKDGSHHFSASSAEHENAVRLLRQAERNSSR
ncbi:MAG TPA: endolytic transglycosylase MltG [Blastocatellia bacterium]|nr:endolytic transglycosylase MltG [Blastocatellia bacterium]